MIGQERAHQCCQSIGIHPTGCRDPRCSLECRHRWAGKHYHILALLFSNYVPQPYARLYGCLKMPEDATLAEHKRAITKLQRQLRKWEQKTGETLRVVLCSHVTRDAETGADRLHHDLVGYSSVSLFKTHEVIKGAWGGSCCSVTEMRTMERAVRYFVKYTRRKPHEFRCLLARRNGVNQLYGLATLCKPFGTSAKALWSEQRKTWFGDEEMESPTYEKAMAHPLVQARVSDIIKAVVNENPTRRDLAQRAGLRSDLFRHALGKLRDNAGLRQCGIDGRLYFDDAVLGVELPPTDANGRRPWEVFKGQCAAETIGRFTWEARKAIGAISPAKTDTNVSYCCSSDSDKDANDNRKLLYASDYLEPPDLPVILRRPVLRA